MAGRATRTSRSLSLARPSTLVPWLALGALVLAGCGGATGGSQTPVPTAPAGTPSTEPSPTAAPTLTPELSPTPEPAPTVFDSVAYSYRATFPAGMLAVAPEEAVQRWDGQATINSDGPYTDKFYRPGDRLLFVYGASTDLDLPGYAVYGQLKKHEWHGCPEVPEKDVETTFGGVPAELYSFTCGGLRVFSLYTVRDGFGVVINQLTPPGNEAADEAEFLELLSGWIWLD